MKPIVDRLEKEVKSIEFKRAVVSQRVRKLKADEFKEEIGKIVSCLN